MTVRALFSMGVNVLGGIYKIVINRARAVCSELISTRPSGLVLIIRLQT